MAKNRMDVLELLRKQAQGANLDFLREGLSVLVQAAASAARAINADSHLQAKPTAKVPRMRQPTNLH